MVKNVGTMDAYLRVTGGLMMVALGTAAMVRRPGLTKVLMIGLGAAKVAEGITHYDPMYRAIGWSTLEKNPMTEMADMVTRAADAATDQAGHVADQVADTTERMTDRAERAGDRVTRTTNRIVRKAEDYMS